MATEKRKSPSHEQDEDVHGNSQKRQRVPTEEHPDNFSAPQFNGHHSEDKPQIAISKKSRDQRRRENRILKTQISELNKEIAKLREERAADRKELEEQRRIANSLSDQINDKKYLVTKDSLVKELRAEMLRERESHTHAVLRQDISLREMRRERDECIDRNRQLEHMCVQSAQALASLRQEYDHKMHIYRRQILAAYVETDKELERQLSNKRVRCYEALDKNLEKMLDNINT
ncbi:hypothetical protein KCU65_g1364, partial [Aureobasidium melanogenum]